MKFLLNFLRWLLGGTSPRTDSVSQPAKSDLQRPTRKCRRVRLAAKRRHVKLDGQNTRWKSRLETKLPPYLFACFAEDHRRFLDLTQDADERRLQRFGLPVFHTPQQLADWLEIPVGKLAWLVHRDTTDRRPPDDQHAHYVYHWVRKRSASVESSAPNMSPVKTEWRLIEAPKATLKAAQRKILTEILDKVPTHPAAHGFVRGRSIVTNARQHVGQEVVIKLDLRNFYANVTFSRVVAIFRSLGYCREAAIGLARLTTSAAPWTLNSPNNSEAVTSLYLRRHLPQGAPTSPALANLSAFSLDVRLSGLLKTFGGNYTRYADDLTLSGSKDFRYALRCVMPLTEQIVWSERFRLNTRKRKVLRRSRRQLVTGVVVNQKVNIPRAEFDRLKAILTNCVKFGPSTQNRGEHEDFAAHLRGRIAFVRQLNPHRGVKLLGLFERIDWRR